MPTPQEILSDPNYVNANPATQQAIRDKYGIKAAAPKDESGVAKALLGKPTVEGAKNLGKAGVSLADTVLEGAAGAVNEFVAYPILRTMMPAEQVDKVLPPVHAPIGTALGIQNDPAYQGEASRRAVTAVGEAIQPGIQKAAEATGLPERDVGNIVSNVSLGLTGPFSRVVRRPAQAGLNVVDKAVDKVAAQPVLGAPIRAIDNAVMPDNQLRADVLRQGPQPKVLPPEAPAVLREGSPESPLSGVGSASVDKAAQRRATAENLDVPVKLTEGQQTQELAQQKLENQIKYAHSNEDAGRAILGNEAAQNLAFKQNFDFMIDELGSLKSGDRVATGQMVTENLKRQVDLQKKLIDRAYRKAEKAGETREFVDTTPLQQYIGSLDDVTKNELAPVLKMVERNLIDEEGNLKPMTLGEYQKLRQAVTAASDAGPNGHYGSKIKEIIDTSTENSGGRYYQEARKLYRDFKKEFEEKGMIERLTTTKKNSSDFKIAVEDVFQKSVISGTKQDLVNLVERLKKGGKGGEAALVELRGNLIDHIYEQATKGVGKDIESQAVPSFPQLKRTVKALQDDGKLEYLLGKDQARKVMNLMEVADSLYNQLPGSKNYSQTAYTLNEKAIEILKGAGRKLPGGDALIRIAEEKARLKQAQEAINPDTEKLNKKLRDLQKREIEILQKGE